jgi:hypothetical protein
MDEPTLPFTMPPKKTWRRVPKQLIHLAMTYSEESCRDLQILAVAREEALIDDIIKGKQGVVKSVIVVPSSPQPEQTHALVVVSVQDSDVFVEEVVLGASEAELEAMKNNTVNLIVDRFRIEDGEETDEEDTTAFRESLREAGIEIFTYIAPVK